MWKLGGGRGDRVDVTVGAVETEPVGCVVKSDFILLEDCGELER